MFAFYPNKQMATGEGGVVVTHSEEEWRLLRSLRNQGRSDDVIKSAGYRIGPAEIESCLVKHPAVANAAVIGKPDETRGAIVKAFVVLQPGFSGNEKLIEEIQGHVRGRLAPYEYPREIEFIDALPMTTTGKVQRKELRRLEEAKLSKA